MRKHLLLQTPRLSRELRCSAVRQCGKCRGIHIRSAQGPKHHHHLNRLLLHVALPQAPELAVLKLSEGHREDAANDCKRALDIIRASPFPLEVLV